MLADYSRERSFTIGARSVGRTEFGASQVARGAVVQGEGPPHLRLSTWMILNPRSPNTSLISLENAGPELPTRL